MSGRRRPLYSDPMAVKLTVGLPWEIDQELREYAARHGSSRSEVARVSIIEYLWRVEADRELDEVEHALEETNRELEEVEPANKMPI